MGQMLSGSLPMLMQVAGGVASAMGSIRQGEAAQRQYEYQAAMLESNAKAREKQASEEVAAGGAEEAKLRQKIAQLRGQQKATMGASGFRTDSGSNLETLLDTDEMGERDVESLRYNAQVKRWANLADAEDMRNQANLARYAGKDAAAAGRLGAFSSMIGTGATVASTWYKTGSSGASNSGASTGWNLGASELKVPTLRTQGIARPRWLK